MTARIETDEALLLDLLNTTPVIDGTRRDNLADAAAGPLAPFLDGVRCRASFVDGGVTWTLDAPRGRSAATRAVLAWDALAKSGAGRLRPCANPDCRLFLIDHSKPNSARWCSMAACGNRMKARRHYQRTRAN